MIQDENGNPRLRSRQETLGVAGASTSVQTRPMIGAASGTQTNPDGTSTATTTEILANGNTRGVAIRKDANGNAIETSDPESQAWARPRAGIIGAPGCLSRGRRA